LPNLLPTDVLSNAVSEASSGSLSPQQFNYSWHYWALPIIWGAFYTAKTPVPCPRIFLK
jgi:hypothetical protein